MSFSASLSNSRGESCLFIQPFSIGDLGGGAKILQSVVKNSPVHVASICTGSGRKQKSNPFCAETFEPVRPSLGRLDATRFAHFGGWVEWMYSPLFLRRLKARIIAERPSALHVVPHSVGDFLAVHRIARQLRIPIHASFHDDLDYSAERHPMKKRMMKGLGELWREAATRFVICEEIGEEYCRRYGNMKYVIHTDGVAKVNGGEWAAPVDELKVYFMGMMNQPYIPSVRAMARALPLLGASSRWRPSFRLRTHGYLPEKGEISEILPFVESSVVTEEMPRQHLLYLPLPLIEGCEGLWRFGFSTKMVSYLASGTPIVYHGPAEAAAGKYLARNMAAVCIHATDPSAVAEALRAALADPEWLQQIRRNALLAATRDFDAAVLHRRFWDAMGFPECCH